ncbi:ChaN family lipoprotein [Hydrogenophaga sp.]|uniref:ChaN family lipoprotein n=1 Tax=Hydrogenophaga sp. TaxID=1904254 RepID=UPI0035B30C34
MAPRTLATALLACALLTACAATVDNAGRSFQDLVTGMGAPALLLVGEQHDAIAHQRLQRQLIKALGGEHRLAAVVMEMAEQGKSTAGLAPSASEAEVRQALDWSEQTGWPWPVYGPVVMSAVRQGIPVHGGNLPRQAMRSAIQDPSLDQLLSPSSLAQQEEGIRQGHCGLLPDSQIPSMVRVQIARDRTLARTAENLVQPGKTVMLIAGQGHVRRDLGVPVHLPAELSQYIVMARTQAEAEHTGDLPADSTWTTDAPPAKDHCAELKRQLGR